MKKIALDKLNTEQINSNSRNLHKKTPLEILKIINDEDQKIANIIKNHLNEINYLIEQIYHIFLQNKNSRLIYIGAGTSGRLGVLDASEMEPTFGIKDKIIGLIAGGDIALKKAIENIEDNKLEAINDLKSINFSSNDILLAISASGYTPYCISALKYAKRLKSTTYSLCMNKTTKFEKYSNYVLKINLGPEIITGSTRMKAGTATKIILNMISTTIMIKLGYVYDSFMINLKPNNTKLKNRAIFIIQKLLNLEYEKAKKLFLDNNANLKQLIVDFKKNKL